MFTDSRYNCFDSEDLIGCLLSFFPPDISLLLVLNRTEKALLETSEDLNLDLKSSNSFAAFGAKIFENELTEPTLTDNDWIEINSPNKNVSFFIKLVVDRLIKKTKTRFATTSTFHQKKISRKSCRLNMITCNFG